MSLRSIAFGTGLNDTSVVHPRISKGCNFGAVDNMIIEHRG
jgi:hypothetical protein